MRIKTGDKVQIIAGKDKGKRGKVLQVFPERELVSVEGLNILIKHMRPRRDGEKGQRVEFPAPLQASNVALVCPKCDKPARVGYQVLDTNKKVRVCKQCAEAID